MADEAAEIIEAPDGFADGSAFEDAPAAETPAEVPATETPTEETPATETPAEPVAATPAQTPTAQRPAGYQPQSLDEAIRQRDGIYSSLKQEREAAKALAEENARLKGRLEGVEMAQRRGVTQVDTPQARTPQETQQLQTWAHRWGMYDTAGNPDIEAAAVAVADMRSLFKGESETTVKTQLQPVLDAVQQASQQTVIAQAAQNKKYIMQVGVEDGADAALLEQYIDGMIQVKPDALGDPAMAVGLIALAKGMTAVGTPRTAPAAPATTPTVIPQPNFSERPGQRVKPAPALQGIERVIAGKRGVNAETWNKNSSDFEDRMNSGRPLVAED